MEKDLLIIEDDPEIISKWEKELTKGRLSFDLVQNLKEAKERIFANKYESIISDGNFPKNNGTTEGFGFIDLYPIIRNKINSKMKLIVWSNSTRIHNFCFDERLEYYSKEKIDDKKYLEKGFALKIKAKSISIKELIDKLK